MFINKHKKSMRLLCWILFAIYIAAMVYFLFFSERLGRSWTERAYHYNLIPFREIRRFLLYREQIGYAAVFFNLAGNVLIFMPFGFLVPAMFRRQRNFFRVVLFGFELSLAVECVQLISKTGSFDVDDILLNTIGSAIGVLIYLIVQHRRDAAADRRRAEVRKTALKWKDAENEVDGWQAAGENISAGRGR